MRRRVTRRVVRRHVATAFASALSAAVAPAVARAQAAFDVKAGAVVAPDTVRIGDPFYVRLRVQAPPGARIEFPTGPDTAGAVLALDPVALSSGGDSTRATDQTATYRVAAWDVGNQGVALGEVVVRVGGDERHVAVQPLRVFVRSVLPADTTLRVPKPARPPFPYAKLVWWPWAVLAAAIVLLLVAWWLWRRRTRRTVAVVPVDPYERARQELDRIDGLNLVEAGERGRYVALVVEVAREYLATRYPATSLAMTSSELLRAVRGERFVPRDRLARLLEEADLVKFARRPLSAERARELGREARGVIEEEHLASTPVPTEAAA